MRLFVILSLVLVAIAPNASQAQMAAQQKAAYIATLKAVTDIKVNDEEHLREMDQLREDQRFYDKLEKMLAKLQNTKNKNSDNRRILKILEKAGEDIYRILQ